MKIASSRRFGTRVARRSHLEIRDIALGARKVLGIDGARIDMIDLLEYGLDSHGIRYHYAPDEEMGEDIARWVPSQGRIVVALSAYESLSKGEPDHHLLIPHEFGHSVLAHESSFGWAIADPHHPLVEDSEWQANVFAFEFTMPFNIVQRMCQSVVDITKVFGVTDRDASVRALMLRTERAIKW